jgi:hypothetical protein
MTESAHSIISIDESNLDDYLSGPACFLNPAHPAAIEKAKWLKECFMEGMRIKLILLEGEKKPISFIEYIDGENAWRAVDAKGYLFIHCLWTTPNKYKNKGFSSALIEECKEEAIDKGLNGLAVITSEDSFMAGREVFVKNGFESVDYIKPHDLMVLKLKDREAPRFRDTSEACAKLSGLHIIYTKQCPWVIRFIDEARELIEKTGAIVTELITAKEAQNAPSIYATLSIVNNGKVLADHYISTTRFKNIIAKELK